MMRRSAGFHADEARRQLLKEWQNVPPLELTANDYITCRVNCVDLKNRLGDIETNCRDRLHVWLLRTVGALNSTHIHGTSVPVEEPSTASKADMRPRFETIRANVRRPPANEITVSRMEKRLEELRPCAILSALWPAQSEITLSAEDIAVKACSRADS